MTALRTRIHHPIFVTLGLALLVAGCADDTSVASTGDAETAGETAGESDTAGEAADMDADTGDGDGDTTGDGDGDTTGDGDGDGDTGPTEIVVGGEVYDFFTMAGIPDATVTVQNMPEFMTVSDAMGNYEIPGMPPNTEVFFLIESDPMLYWGGVRPAMLPDMDIDNLQLGQVATELIDLQLGLVQMQNPDVMKDETKSIIIVRLLQQTAAPGATVTFDPPLPPDQYYGVNDMDQPVLGGDMIDSQLLPFWVAFNVEPDEAGGAYSITVDHPERECTVLHPAFPTLERFVTLVDVDCPPP